MPNVVELGSASWRPVARLRTHEQVLAQIEEQVVEGSLRPGDRLPGERQLAEALGVSRAAVREALRVLESMGVIAAGTGSGPAAGSIIVGNGSPALGNVLRLHLALASFSQRELVEVRIQLEAWAAHEAADRASEADLAPLRELVKKMRSPALPYATFNELDSEFHVTIASITGNSLLRLLMQALRDAIRREMVAVFETLPDSAPVVKRLCKQHEAILAALAAHDSSRASRLVREHIRRFYTEVAGETWTT